MSIPIAWSEIYAHPLPAGHRFPMEKYELIPQQLLYEGTITKEQLFAPDPLTEEQITSTHDLDYWLRLKEGTLSKKHEMESGFPWSKKLIERETIICNGTVVGAELALTNTGCAFNVAGGTHHAFRDRPEGFCLLNDIAISAINLMNNHALNRILVIDLDVHQGNGTANIFQDDNRVFTFSMHGQKNYPFRKEESDLDIGLPDGIDDEAYLRLLEDHLEVLMDDFNPQFVFFQSGVDILESDKLGKLKLTIQGCRIRDKMVLEACSNRGIPIQISMGGGYSPKISDIVEAHANTFRLAMTYYS